MSTMGGAELGCLVAMKTLEILERPMVKPMVNYIAETFRNGLHEIMKLYPGFFVGIRQLGLVMGLEFDYPEGAKPVMKHLYENGVWAIFSTLDPRVLQFKPGVSWETLALKGDETVDVVLAPEVKPLSDATLVITGADGTRREVLVTLPAMGSFAAGRLKAVTDLAVAVMPIADASEGMSASLRAGAAAADGRALMILLPDMPEIDASDLAQMLAASGIRAIYTTEYRRTVMLAAPLAKQLAIPSVVVPGAEQDAGPGTDDVNRQRLASTALESRNRISADWRSLVRLARGADHIRTDGAFPGFVDTDQDQASWQNDVAALGGQWVAGLDWRREKVASDTAYTVSARRFLGAFAGVSARLGEHLIEASARHDDDSQFGGHATGKLAWGYKLTPQWRASARASRPWTAPRPGASARPAIPSTRSISSGRAPSSASSTQRSRAASSG